MIDKDYELIKEEKYNNGNVKIKEFKNKSNEILKIKYNENGVIIRKAYLNKYGYNRSEDKPSIIGYFSDGSLYYESYYKGGLLHRENKPATIEYVNGMAQVEAYYINGKKGRLDSGPIIITYFEDTGEISKEVYLLKDVYNEDVSMEIFYRRDGSIMAKNTRKNNKFDSMDGKPSAVTYREDGTIEKEVYHKSGYFHNSNGPAIIYRHPKDSAYNEYYYYLNGGKYEEFEYFVKIGTYDKLKNKR